MKFSKKMGIFLGALAALVMSLAPTQAIAETQPSTPTISVAAADGNRDNCRGIALPLFISGSNVVAPYRVTCDVKQSTIYVSADAVRHTSGLPSARVSTTCTNTTTCTVNPKIGNPSGTQLFTGAVYGAVATRSGYRIGCGASVQPGLINGIMSCSQRSANL